jgi:hypothetical protein
MWEKPLKKPLMWKAEPGSLPNTAFSTQVGKLITYYAVARIGAHLAYVELRDRSGGPKRLDLGKYVEMEEAKGACDQHYMAGCDLSKAK